MKLTMMMAARISLFLVIVFFYPIILFADVDLELLRRVENHLNSISSINTNFIQKDSQNESESSGVLYISRPGKLRIDYAKPNNITIIANNGVITYEDRELKEVNHITAKNIPVFLLLRKNILFSDPEVKVLDTKLVDGNIHITLKLKGKKDDISGKFTIIFREEPMIFQKMIVEDTVDGKNIEMDFKEIKYNTPIKSSLFNMKDTRLD